MPRTIIHLVDDSTPGGVMRMLSHIEASPLMARIGRHDVREISRGSWSAPRLTADVIVSHLSVSWRNMPLLIALRALHPQVPLVHVEHSYSEAFVAENLTKRDRFFTLLRTAYALFDRVIGVSSGQASWLAREGLVNEHALRAIPSAVSLSDFLALSPSASERARVFGAIGRLHRQKGFDLLIEAFRAAEIPGSRLLVFGEGSERSNLEILAAGDPRIEFRGFATEPWRAIEECDAVVMPSRWEPFGLVALEAQAAGRAVICAEIDGLCDHVEGGALTVSEASVEVWASALQKAARLDLRARTVQGRCHAAGHARRFADAWVNLIDEVTSTADDQRIAC